MGPNTRTADLALLTIVALHLGLCLVHGAAHARALVPLSPAANAFVLLVILGGPLAGMAVWRWVDRRTGAWIAAATLAGALTFGVLNHFVIPGGDHVGHVQPPWRMLFGVTAVLLAITEGLGSGIAIWSALRTGRS